MSARRARKCTHTDTHQELRHKIAGIAGRVRKEKGRDRERTQAAQAWVAALFATYLKRSGERYPRNPLVNYPQSTENEPIGRRFQK